MKTWKLGSKSTMNEEQRQALEALDIVYIINHDAKCMRFKMKDGVPEFSVPMKTWDDRPTWVIGAAARYLALADGNEKLREMVENPITFYPFKQYPLDADTHITLEAPEKSVELPVKGEVHTEPNQQPDGTIGDTGRFL